MWAWKMLFIKGVGASSGSSGTSKTFFGTTTRNSSNINEKRPETRTGGNQKRNMALQVAIIGAGLGGPALALELLDLPNVTCTIYELRPEGYEQGQHISLAPNAMRVMANIGVLEKLQAIGNTYEELHLRNAKGARIATFNNGSKDKYGFSAMRIHRRHVQQVLIEECKAKGVEICHGMKLKSIREQHDRGQVDMTFENGQTVQADFVVGADGLHSVVRSHVVADSSSVSAHMLGVTGYLQKKNLHSSVDRIGLPSHFIGHNGFIAIMPSDVSGNEIGFFSTMDFKEDRSRAEWDMLFNNKEAVRAILRERFCVAQGWSELADSMCATAEAETLCSWPYVTCSTRTAYRSLFLLFLFSFSLPFLIFFFFY